LTKRREVGRKVKTYLVKKSFIWRDPGSVPSVKYAGREV